MGESLGNLAARVKKKYLQKSFGDAYLDAEIHRQLQKAVEKCLSQMNVDTSNKYKPVLIDFSAFFSSFLLGKQGITDHHPVMAFIRVVIALRYWQAKGMLEECVDNVFDDISPYPVPAIIEHIKNNDLGIQRYLYKCLAWKDISYFEGLPKTDWSAAYKNVGEYMGGTDSIIHDVKTVGKWVLLARRRQLMDSPKTDLVNEIALLLKNESIFCDDIPLLRKVLADELAILALDAEPFPYIKLLRFSDVVVLAGYFSLYHSRNWLNFCSHLDFPDDPNPFDIEKYGIFYHASLTPLLKRYFDDAVDDSSEPYNWNGLGKVRFRYREMYKELSDRIDDGEWLQKKMAVNTLDFWSQEVLAFVHVLVERLKASGYFKKYGANFSDVLRESLLIKLDKAMGSQIAESSYREPGYFLMQFLRSLLMLDYLFHHQHVEVIFEKANWASAIKAIVSQEHEQIQAFWVAGLPPQFAGLFSCATDRSLCYEYVVGNKSQCYDLMISDMSTAILMLSDVISNEEIVRLNVAGSSKKKSGYDPDIDDDDDDDDEDDELDVSGDVVFENFMLKVLSKDKNNDHVSYSIKVTVTNNSPDRDITIVLHGLDSEGFEIYYAYIDKRVPVGETKEITSLQSSYDLSDFLKVKTWECDDIR